MNSLTRDKQIKFYEREIESLLNEYELYFKSNIDDLKNTKDLFLGIYLGIDSVRGNFIVKFRKSTAPALKVPLLALKFPDSIFDFSNWKNISYENLRSKAEITSDVLPIFIQKNIKEEFIEVGFSQTEIAFLDSLVIGQYVVFGRKEPPIKYYTNLIEATKKINPNSIPGVILDTEYNDNDFEISKDDKNIDILLEINNYFKSSDIAIIQGPPGTGKTTILARICNYLLENNYSVLVSALTNRALIELVSKEGLSCYLKDEKISKTNLNSEEQKYCKGLKNCDKVLPAKGELVLTTYYKMTDIANETDFETIFDFVILEEASQSFLGTIACAKALGRKLLIVGDHMQLPPVVSQRNPSIIDKNINWLIYGLKHFASKDKCLKIRLTGSYRLLPEAINQTGVFYDNSLISLSHLEMPSIKFQRLSNLFNPKGGTSLYFSNFKHEGKLTISVASIIIRLIKELQSEKPDIEIAVLTAFRKSRNFLQDNIYSEISNSENIVIETIDRIQGLTCDFTFFIVPYDNPSFSFNMNRFNVATSRARYCTLIFLDDVYKLIPPYNGLVAEYISNCYMGEGRKLNNSNFTNLKVDNNVVNQSNTKNSNLPGLKVITTIDVTKFEKPKKEIVKGKENIYIIDTNVFVDHPEIISKIDTKYSIVLSAKVIDELDYLKISLSEEQKKNVQKSLRLINDSIDKRGVKMDTADLTLLPNDFNKKSPDNFILSVALKYKNENPIMLTSDNGLQIKAKGLGITTITLKEFLNQRKY